jgi:hypothetical protein
VAANGHGDSRLPAVMSWPGEIARMPLGVKSNWVPLAAKRVTASGTG